MILLVLIALSSISQTSSAIKDSGLICIPMYQARAAVKALDSFRIMKQEFFLVKMQYSVLDERFNQKDALVKEWEKKSAIQKEKENNLDEQVKTATAKFNTSQIEVAGLKKDVSREKLKIKLFGGVSIAILGTMAYFLLK